MLPQIIPVRENEDNLTSRIIGINFTNNYAKYVIGLPEAPEGFSETLLVSKSLIFHDSSENVISTSSDSETLPFAFYKYKDEGEQTYVSSNIINYTPENDISGTLVIGFVNEADSSDITMEIFCKAYEKYFSFQITNLLNSGVPLIDEIELSNFTKCGFTQIRIKGNANSMFTGSIFTYGTHVISEFALNIETNIVIRPNTYELATEDIFLPRKNDWNKASVILLACPKSDWVSIVKGIEEDFESSPTNFPYPKIEGIWAKEHPDIKSPYLFVDITSKNVDYMISSAKQGGFKYIVARKNSWTESNGSYEINTNNYPLGLASLKTVANEVHNAGLKFGLHCLSWRIDENDSILIDHPDYLAQDPETLELERTSNGKFLPNLDDGLEAIADNFAYVYNEIEADFVYLDGIEGDDDPKTSWYQVAKVAKTFYDKLKPTLSKFVEASVRRNNYLWHIVSRTNSGDFPVIGVEAYMDFQRIKLLEQRNKRDFIEQELGWIKLTAKPEPEDPELIQRFRDFYPSTTLDQIEYQMNRSLGHELPISLHTDERFLKANGYTGRILELIANYEKVRIDNLLPKRFLDKLKFQEAEEKAFVEIYQNEDQLVYFKKMQYHLLLNKDGACGLKKRIYLERVLDFGEEWTFYNPFSEQELKVKLTALPSCKDYIDLSNIILIENNIFNEIKIEEQSIEGVCNLTSDLVTETIQLELTKISEGKEATDWCELTKVFEDEPKDLLNHKVIALEVTGNSSGEIVSIQLNSGQVSRQYQFEIDFVGKKIIELNIADTQEKELFIYPYGKNRQIETTGVPFGIKNSFRPFDYSKVDSITIWIKNITTDSDITFGQIKALHQTHDTIFHPRLSIDSRTDSSYVQFSVNLDSRKTIINPKNPVDDLDKKNAYYEPWDYIVFDGEHYVKYDGNNINVTHIQEEIESPSEDSSGYPETEIPEELPVKLPPLPKFTPEVPPSFARLISSSGTSKTTISTGNNTIEFNHTGANKAKALVTILLEDEPEYVGETPILNW